MRTIRKRLEDVINNDKGVYQVNFRIKAKTKDGLIFTLVECGRKKDESKDFVTDVIGFITEIIMKHISFAEENPDKFCMSVDEGVCIRNNEISRVWADIDEFLTTSEYTVPVENATDL